MFKQILRMWPVCVLMLCCATSAGAQDKSVSVGIGYQFLQIEDRSFPAGVAVDLVCELWPHLAAVGDVSWSRDAAHQFGFRDVATVLHAGGGPRWSASRARRFQPFGQVILGLARNSRAIDQFGDDSASRLEIQPGAGVIVRLNPRQELFGQIDVRRAFGDEEPVNAVDVVVGVRFKLR